MSETRPTRWQRTQQFFRATFTNRLLLAVLGVSLIPLAVLGGTMYMIASRSLVRAESEKLEAVRTIKAAAVVDYFHAIRDHLLTFAESRMISQAMQDFQESLPGITVAGATSAEAGATAPAPAAQPSLEEMRRKVRAYYENEFLRTYDAQKDQWGTANRGAQCRADGPGVVGHGGVPAVLVHLPESS